MVIAGTALVFVLVVSILAILSMVLTGGAGIPGWK